MTDAGRAIPPLNGVKTHPLSAHALRVLRRLEQSDYPAGEINPGVVNRLMRGGLAVVYAGPSPYRTGKGTVSWMSITALGRATLGERE